MNGGELTAEQMRINALHEAWHCAALVEEGIPVHYVINNETHWDSPDGRAEALINLVPNIAMPEHPSSHDFRLMDEAGMVRCSLHGRMHAGW